MARYNPISVQAPTKAFSMRVTPKEFKGLKALQLIHGDRAYAHTLRLLIREALDKHNIEYED